MTTRNRELASIIDASGNITTGGNLSVTGNLTQTSSNTTSYSDGLLELNTGAGSNSNDLGLVMERGSTGDNAIFLWDESNDGFAVGTTTAVGTATGNISFSAAPFTASTITGTVLTGSTSVKTPLIEYTDGDDAITIADGGHITTGGNLSIGGSNNELRFYEGSNYVGFEAPALSADKIWVLPAADGSANQILKTDGSGNLSFTDDLTLAAALVNNYTGNGSATGYTLSAEPNTENSIQAYIDGVYQNKNSFAYSGTTLTFDTAPGAGALIEVLVWNTVAVNVPADGSVTNSTLSPLMITSQTAVTAADADHILIYDASASALRKALVSDLLQTNEEIQDLIGAMFSSNTETGIAATYVDGGVGAGKINLVIGDDSIVSSMLDTNITIAGTLAVAGDANFDSNTLFVDASTNRVGVGTTSPSHPLHIKTGTTSTYLRLETNDGDTGYIGYTQDEGIKLATATGSSGVKVYIKDGNNDDILTIDASTGRVGIGTTTPAEKLHVVNAATEDFLFETTSNNTRSLVTTKSKDSSGNNVQLKIGSMGDGPYGMLFTLTNHNLAFATNNAGPQMTLKTDGNVGIGQTNPAYDLDIVDSTSASNTNAALNLSHASKPQIRFVQTSNNTRAYIGIDTNDLVIRNDDGVEKVRFEQNGNVAISGVLTASTGIVGRGVIESSSGFSSNTFAVMGVNTSNSATNHGAVFASKHADSNALLVGSHDATFNSFAVKGDGKVGIGTTAPASTLHITTSTNSPMLVESTHGDGGYIELQLSDSGGAGSLTGYIGDSQALVASGTAADLAIRAQANFVVSTGGSTERVRILANGNVGIGTASPAQPLTIKSNGAVSYNGATDLDGESFLTLEGTSADGEAAMIRWANHGAMNNYFGVVQVGSSGQGDFVWTSYNGSAYAERMRITAAGIVLFKKSSASVNVAGGYIDGGEAIMSIADGGSTYLVRSTTSSTYTHYVNGDGSMYTAGPVGIGIASASAPLHIQTNNAETDDSVTGLMITTLSTGTTTPNFGGAIQFQAERNNGVNQNTGLIACQADVNAGTNISSGFRFSTSTAGALNERMRLTYDGKLAIGTPMDCHRRLNVMGQGSETCDILIHNDSDTDNQFNGLMFKSDSQNNNTRIKGAIFFERTGTRGTGTLHFCNDGANDDGNAGLADSKLNIIADGTVTVPGQFNTSSGASKVMRTSQRTAISGTTNTTIVTTIGASGGSSASAAQVIVYGSNNAANAFMDTLNCMGSQAVVVAQSSTLDGSPHSRTYSISGLNLNVQLSSGASGYAVNCCVTTLQFPF